MSTNVSEIGQLIAQARSLTSRAQAIIDLGVSPEAMAVILEDALKTANTEVNVVINQAVNEAITQQQDVAAAVETAISAAIDTGKISGVTQAQVDQAGTSAAQEGGAVSETVATRLASALSVTEVEVDGEQVTQRGEVAEAIHQSMRQAIDGGSVETPGGAAQRAKQEIELASAIGGVSLAHILTVNDRIDMGVIN
jgi:hypothetical protein